MDGWWSSFFDETYSTIGLESTDEAKREATVDAIANLLGVAPGAHIFDQCCGIGRISVPLARRGFRVTGVDLIPRYAELAKERAPSGDFHAADAFEFVAPTPCDGAINWFTSFGYHHDDAVNVQMLRRAYESLKPGAKLALDYVNVPRVFAEYKSVTLDRLPQANGEMWLIQEPSVDFVRGMLLGTWTFLRPDGTREVRKVENRAFMPHELVRLFHEAGFVEVTLYGPDGKPFERTSRRLVIVGKRSDS
ncbi:MAG: methyltransferase domain-containing protein [Myxococcota bacterium]|nr:methyltransferase domain-containing protein [Myxococcota bacterium]